MTEKDTPKPEKQKKTTSREEIPVEAKNSGKGWLFIAGAVAFLAVAYVVAIMLAEYRMGKLVDASLERIETQYTMDGRRVTVHRGELEIEKFTLKPTAMLHDVELEIVDDHKKEKARTRLGSVVYKPKSFDLRSHYQVILRDDIEMLHAEDGETEKHVKVAFRHPPVLEVQAPVAGGNRHYRFDISDRIVLYHPDEAEMAGAEMPVESYGANRVEVQFKNTPVIEWQQAPNGEIANQSVVLDGVSVAGGDVPLASIDALSLKTTKQPLENGRQHLELSFLVNALEVYNDKLEVANPIRIVTEIAYDGPKMKGVTPEAVASNGPLELELKEVAVISNLLEAYAKGNVHATGKPGQFPTGEVELRLNKVEALMAHLAAEHPEAADYFNSWRGIIEKISGTKVEVGSSHLITLSRDEGGRLMIGQATMEEAMMLFLGAVMAMPDLSDAAEAQTPAAPKELMPKEVMPVQPLPDVTAEDPDVVIDETIGLYE
ncbi:MAG: hypothetical protein ACPG80_01665, partial [Rickettsiales bacterium]